MLEIGKLNPETTDAHDRDQARYAQSDDKKRYGLSEDELRRENRAHHDLFEGADLALSDDGERR